MVINEIKLYSQMTFSLALSSPLLKFPVSTATGTTTSQNDRILNEKNKGLA